jgi:hypothetical protein
MVASNGFDIKFSTKDHDADLERLMTGQLISALELSLEFDEKEEFLKLCREMGEIRNRLTHELARKVDLGKLEATTDKYRAKNKRAEELFFEADDTFRLLYKDYKKDDSWDWTLQEMIEDDGLDGDMKAQCKRIIKLRKAAGYSLNFESSLR